MIKLPDPQQYDDPIRYFRDSHGVVGAVLDRFSKLVDAARKVGVRTSFETSPEWQELLEFFVRVAPIHEMDEERALFPVVLEKVTHIGFQSPTAPNRFIHEQHTIMQQRSKALLALWEGYLIQQSLSIEDEKRFLDIADELVKLYHEHITMENQIIYTAANDNLLTPPERIAIMLMIRELHSERTVMPVIGFENTIYDPLAEHGDDTAVSKTIIDSDEESDDEETEN
ncbi:MAG TPA: hemerythrin domain-containing protein [Candidatus Kapabacteria bacterium]|nr:hemerythrin domain-containing protein [Candidatus Kapabacteria bacterium]